MIKRVKVITYKYLSLNFKALVLFLVLISSRAESFGQILTFDKEKWKANSEYRYSTVKDSSFYNLIIGKSKNEILKLIDKPCYYNKNKLVYCLDICDINKKKKCKKNYCVSSFFVVEMKNGISRDLVIVWKGN